MAEVHIVDIDGEQWNIKDQPLTERVANLEEAVSTKGLPDVIINMKSGYTASTKNAFNHYSVGKIHFMTIRFDNLAGTNIGTGGTANIATTDLRPKKQTSFILNDFLSKAVLRCYLDIDGTIAVGESTGVQSGSNSCYGELIFAEE